MNKRVVQTSLFPRLPYEMWTNIFEYVRPTELVPCYKMCLLWNSILTTNSVFGRLLVRILFLVLPYLSRSELMTLRLVSKKLSARVNRLLEHFMKGIPECSNELFESWKFFRFVPRIKLSFHIFGEVVTNNDDVDTAQEHPLPSTNDYLLQVDKLLNENWKSVVLGRALEVNVLVMPGVNTDSVKCDPALEFFRKFGKRIWNLRLMVRMREPPKLRKQFLNYLNCTPELRSVNLFPQWRVPRLPNFEPDPVAAEDEIAIMQFNYDLTAPVEMPNLNRISVDSRMYFRGDLQSQTFGDQYFLNIFHRQLKHISYLYMYHSQTNCIELMATCSSLAEIDICFDDGMGWVHIGNSKIRKLTLRSIYDGDFLTTQLRYLLTYLHWGRNTLTKLHFDCRNITHSDLFDASFNLPHLTTLVVTNVLFTTITGMKWLVALKTYHVMFSDQLLPALSQILGTVESGTNIWSVVPSLERFIYKERRGAVCTVLHRPAKLAQDI